MFLDRNDLHTATHVTVPKMITLWTSTFLPDDVVDGDIDYRDVDSEMFLIDSELRDDDETAVAAVVRFLTNRGLTEASQSPVTLRNAGYLWFSNPDGSVIIDHYTGEREDVSAHVTGFTDAEMLEIAETLAIPICIGVHCRYVQCR